MRKRINVTEPFLPHISEYVKILRRAWGKKYLTNGGELHRELEAAICDYLKVPYVNLFCNGTTALIVAYRALRLTGEVITSPYGFAATRNSLEWAGLTPVYVDTDGFNLNPELIAEKVTDKTSAILPVHVYGFPCDTDAIQAVAERFGLRVVYDACHAFGCVKNGLSLLSFGDLSVCSFHATKVFNTFEGGCIVSHSRQMYERIELLKNFGIKDGALVDTGINGKMSEAHAAMGLLQMQHIDTAIDRRRYIAAVYEKLLFGADTDFTGHNCAYYPVMLTDRDACFDELTALNIWPRKYFDVLLSDGDYPIAGAAASSVLCLPIYPDLEIADVELICKIVNKYL